MEEKTADGQMGPGRRQRGDCGATGVEFVANKLVIKEGSGCGGEWGAVCVTKGSGGMVPRRS